VLNTQLRSLLEQKLTSTAVTKLQELAGMANDISKGFLTISMTEEVQRHVDTAEESEDEQRAYKVLMDTFHSSKKLGKEIFRVDSLSLQPFLACLKGVPKVLLFSTQDTEIPPLYQQLFKQFHEGLLFGIVSCNDTKTAKEFKVEATPTLLVITEELPEPVKYQGKLALEDLSVFLSHFCVAFTRVTPVSNFSMPYYLQHCPQDTPLVMLYTERADMPPLYTELAKNFRMFLFAIIRNTETELVSKFNITKYPQVIVKPSASDKGVYYNGAITPKDVHNWLVKFIMDMNTIVKLVPETIEMYLKKEPEKPKVILFTGHKEIPRLYEDLWRRFHLNMCFCIMFEPDDDIKSKYGVDQLPTLFKVRRNGAPMQKYEGQINPKGVCDFLKNFADEVR